MGSSKATALPFAIGSPFVAHRGLFSRRGETKDDSFVVWGFVLLCGLFILLQASGISLVLASPVEGGIPIQNSPLPQAPLEARAKEFTHFVQQDDGMPKPLEPQRGDQRPRVEETTLPLYGGAQPLPSQNMGQSKAHDAPPSHLIVKPSSLNFGERPICIPVSQTITISNTSPDTEVQVYEITSDSVHLHCSLPNQTVVPPNTNTSAMVLFLPRQVSAIEGVITIHTNAGDLLYQVKGIGTLNPYRLRPISGAKVVAGNTFFTSIELYNPHMEPLNVKEVYTSGGFLALSLPQPVEGQSNLHWEIMPHQRKKMINVEFSSATPGKFEGLINVKTDHDSFLIPVEVIVVKDGLHAVPDEIDFGTLTSSSQTRQRHLSFLNAGPTPVRIFSLAPLTPDPQLAIFMLRSVVPPGSEVKVATMTYSGGTLGKVARKLVAKTNGSDAGELSVQIAYKARTLHGSLGYNPSETMFPSGEPREPVAHRLTLTNKFSVPLAIHLMEVNDPHFEILGFIPGVTILPGASWNGLEIRFMPSSKDMFYSTDLSLSTNISALRIPLQCYHGRLLATSGIRGSVLDTSDAINFGVISLKETQRRILNLTNVNPAPVTIERLSANISGFSILLDRIYGASGEVVLRVKRNATTSNSTNQAPVVLEPRHVAIYAIELMVQSEEKFDGEVLLKTNFEQTALPVSYRSLEGGLSIVPMVLKFEGAFPGRTVKKSLVAQSTYSWPVQIVSITASDPRVVTPSVGATTLQPNQPTEIGEVVFNASLGQSEGVDEDTSLLSGFGEPVNSHDIVAVRQKEKQWRALEKAGKTSVKGVLTVATDVLTKHSITFRATLVKPSIVKTGQRVQDFGLVQSGSSLSRMFPVHNPSDQAIYVQLIPFPTDNSLLPTPTSPAFFIPPDACKIVLLQPRSSTQLGPVFFSPQSLQRYNATLWIKNQLTVLDHFLLAGEGGSGHFVFQEGDRAVTTLRFVLTEDMLSACRSSNSRAEVVITKKLRAINRGNLPIKVEKLSLHRYGCEAFGFRVSNCSGFTLNPNESIDITLTYRPDFLAANVEKTLVVITSRGELFFTLVASTPANMLSACAGLQPMSSFEEYLRRTFFSLLVLGFAILVFVVIREQKRSIAEYLLEQPEISVIAVKRKLVKTADELLRYFSLLDPLIYLGYAKESVLRKLSGLKTNADSAPPFPPSVEADPAVTSELETEEKSTDSESVIPSVDLSVAPSTSSLSSEPKEELRPNLTELSKGDGIPIVEESKPKRRRSREIPKSSFDFKPVAPAVLPAPVPSYKAGVLNPKPPVTAPLLSEKTSSTFEAKEKATASTEPDGEKKDRSVPKIDSLKKKGASKPSVEDKPAKQGASSSGLNSAVPAQVIGAEKGVRRVKPEQKTDAKAKRTLPKAELPVKTAPPPKELRAPSINQKKGLNNKATVPPAKQPPQRQQSQSQGGVSAPSTSIGISQAQAAPSVQPINLGAPFAVQQAQPPQPKVDSHQRLRPLPITSSYAEVGQRVEEMLQDEMETRSPLDLYGSFLDPIEMESDLADAENTMMNPIFDDSDSFFGDARPNQPNFFRDLVAETDDDDFATEDDYPEWADAELPALDFEFAAPADRLRSNTTPSSPDSLVGPGARSSPWSTSPHASPDFFLRSPHSSGSSGLLDPMSFFSPFASPDNGAFSSLLPSSAHSTFHNPLFGAATSASTGAASPPHPGVQSPQSSPLQDTSLFSRTPGPARASAKQPPSPLYQLF